MSRIVVLGYGNPLRGDDAIGWLAAQALQGRLQGDNVTVIATHQLNPEHAETVAKSDLAIFIDASSAGPPGTITQSDLLPAECSARPSTHNLTPEVLLACARELYGSCPRAVLFAVGASHFNYGKVSQSISESLPLLLEEVVLICRSYATI